MSRSNHKYRGNFTELPVIDISGLYSHDPAQRKAVADRLGRAAHTVGFLYIKGHHVEERLLNRALAASKQFFNRPSEFKSRYYIGDSPNHRGYVPVTEKGDYADEEKRRYEAFDLSLDLPAHDPDYLAGNPLLGPNVWPDVSGFQSAISEYCNAMLSLAYLLTAAFEEYMDVEEGYFRSRMMKPTSQLRLIHYLENNEAVEDGQNMGAHTDYECFTILRQFSPGLQVLNPAGEWIDVEPIPGTFVINIGDMLETWSGGYLRSTLHRVVNNGRERYSMPFFMAADYDAVVEPIPGYESDEPRHKPLVAGQHLLRMLLRDFPYLKRMYLENKLNLDLDVRDSSNPFEDRVIASQQT